MICNVKTIYVAFYVLWNNIYVCDGESIVLSVNLQMIRKQRTDHLGIPLHSENILGKSCIILNAVPLKRMMTM